MNDDQFHLFDESGDPAKQLADRVERGDMTEAEALVAALALAAAECTDVMMAFVSAMWALGYGEMCQHIRGIDVRQGPGVLAVGFKIEPGWDPQHDTTEAEREAMATAVYGILRAGGLDVDREGATLVIHNEGEEDMRMDPWSGALEEFRSEMDRALGNDAPDPFAHWMQQPKEGGP